MKAKYKAKVNLKRCAFFSCLVYLVKDMWSKFLSIKHSSNYYFQQIKCGVNLTM